MAINKNLDVGSMMFRFHTSNYVERFHRLDKKKYIIYFKVLYIHNRRERTSGAEVPRHLAPTLSKLGIRIQDYGNETVTAIGCRTNSYHRTESHLPYPALADVEQAEEKFNTLVREETNSAEGTPLKQNDFIQQFQQKKMSNKDALFVLQKPLQDYLANETYTN